MILCAPNGLFSWKYELMGDGIAATTCLKAFGERGSLTVGGETFTVNKTGMFHGEWVLERNGTAVATARKEGLMSRSFRISAPSGHCLLRKQNAIGRSMVLENGASRVDITPLHAFTRRAKLTGAYPDPRIIVFAFWLTALLWRRIASNNSM